jgi:hypothetical protein
LSFGRFRETTVKPFKGSKFDETLFAVCHNCRCFIGWHWCHDSDDALGAAPAATFTFTRAG